VSLTTISEISNELCISTRTLRYYEQIGLIHSSKKDDYAYRAYDEDTVTRLRQILVLRKLRIPLKQIDVILQSENTAEMIDLFEQNLAEVDDEISTLSTIREIISSFVTRLNKSIHQDIKLNLLDDTDLLEAADALTVASKHPRFSMSFDIAHNDIEMIEVFAFYQKAFGANKIAEFTPPGSDKDNLHIIMKIHDIDVLLHPVHPGDERIQPGGLWAYDNDDDLRKTIDTLSQEAREITMHTWPHWPICAIVTDRYGIEWVLHN
jgi:DNA-binding transcriptional MerR regulator/uncharacterized glyoxalase superfamily protein PhnB